MWHALSARYHALIDGIGAGTGLPDTILYIHAEMTVLHLPASSLAAHWGRLSCCASWW